MNRTLLLALSLLSFTNAIAGPAETGLPEKPAMLFMENKGQVQGTGGETQADILYQLSGNGVNVSLSRNAIYYTFFHAAAAKSSSIEAITSASPFYDVEGMDMQLLGANPDPEIVSGHEQPYYENYYSAAPGGRRMEHLRSFERISYQNVYPGIDLVIHAPQDENVTLAKLEFVVHEGANPADIRIRYGRSAALSIKDDGSVVAEHAGDRLTVSSPYAFVRETGDECAARYNLGDGNVMSFAVRKRTYGTLVIVPRILVETSVTRPEAATVTESTMFRGGAFQVSDLSRMSNLVSIDESSVRFSLPLTTCLSKFSEDGKLLWTSWFTGNLLNTVPALAIDSTNETIFVSQLTSGNAAGRAGTSLSRNTTEVEGFVAMFDLGGTLIKAGVYGKTGSELVTKAETTSFHR